MAEIEYLTPQEWTDVLTKDTDLQDFARKLVKGDYLPWVDLLADLCGDSADILDLGSGAGQNSAVLALKGKRTTLLDWSQGNIEFSQNLYKTMKLQGKFLKHDMKQPLPFADNEFDTVFSCGVFEYFTDEEIVSILKEAFRVARKQVIIMAPNAFSIAYRFGKRYMEKKGQWFWGKERPFYSLKSLFQKADKCTVKEFSVGTKHSLTFLTMRGGKYVKKLIEKFFFLKDHCRPAALKQGYLLITVGEKR